MERPSKDGFPPPAGGMSPSRSSERRVPDGKKPKLNTCWSLTLEKDFPCCALNRAEGCHVLFHSPQFQPSDSVILPSPKHRCRGGSMAARLKPAAVQVLGLSRQVCSRGNPRAKSKQNTLLVVGRGGRARRREYGILALEEEQMRVCAKHFGAPWLTVLFAELPECLLRSCQHPSFSSL